MSDAQLYHEALLEYRSGKAAPELISKAYVLASASTNPKAEEIEFVKLRVAELKSAKRSDIAKSALVATVDKIQPHVVPALNVFREVVLWAVKIAAILLSVLLLGAFALALAGGFQFRTDNGSGIIVLVGGIVFGLVGLFVRPRKKTDEVGADGVPVPIKR